MSLNEERFHQYSSYKSGIWAGQINEEPPADLTVEPSREIAELNAQRRRNDPEQTNDTKRCTHDTAAHILTPIKNAVFFSGC